jgi:salicylate hydroxylase
MADMLIAGGGIGGLAAALALQRQNLSCELWEQAQALTEVGAGIQMGPNVTRILNAWGLTDALMAVAVQPSALVSCDAISGRELGRLPLHDMAQRHGAPYLTLHRADLQSLLQAAIDPARVNTHLNRTLSRVQMSEGRLQVSDDQHRVAQSRLLVGADGLWSQVRAEVWQDGAAQPTGHWAYRSLLPMGLLPKRWREPVVQVWMAPGLHAVHYPVRRGEWLNVVVLVEGADRSNQPGWDVARSPDAIQADVLRALRGLCHELHDVLRPVEQWRAWSLFARPSLRGANDMARGSVALLGDAAHPMLPYLAQGAGMAIEDAQVLAQCLLIQPNAPEDALQDYAQRRWARNARVQNTARRNGQIFHAQGLMAWARNTALRLAAPQLMDQPWLYAHSAL